MSSDLSKLDDQRPPKTIAERKLDIPNETKLEEKSPVEKGEEKDKVVEERLHQEVFYLFEEDSNQEKLQAKQQHRLLHLRHAIKCPYEKTKCPISPHCWKLKLLWKHLLVCKEQYCSTPLCVSSRFLLDHYRKCPKNTCVVCLPVRETYKRAHTEAEEREILLRIPPKRMRVSCSPSNFPVTNRNTFDEDRDTRTRIMKDIDSKSDPLLDTMANNWSIIPNFR